MKPIPHPYPPEPLQAASSPRSPLKSYFCRLNKMNTRYAHSFCSEALVVLLCGKWRESWKHAMSRSLKLFKGKDMHSTVYPRSGSPHLLMIIQLFLLKEFHEKALQMKYKALLDITLGEPMITWCNQSECPSKILANFFFLFFFLFVLQIIGLIDQCWSQLLSVQAQHEFGTIKNCQARKTVGLCNNRNKINQLFMAVYFSFERSSEVQIVLRNVFPALEHLAHSQYKNQSLHWL